MMRSHPQRGPDTSPSGRLGSGVLSQPMPAIPAISPAISPAARSHNTRDDLNDRNDLSEFADLAPTEPQLASIPRLPLVRRRHSDALRLTIARAFSEFALGEDWLHDEALDIVPLDLRMRLFSALAPVYLRVVQTTGRMELPNALDAPDVQ